MAEANKEVGEVVEAAVGVASVAEGEAEVSPWVEDREAEDLVVLVSAAVATPRTAKPAAATRSFKKWTRKAKRRLISTSNFGRRRWVATKATERNRRIKYF